MNTVIEPLVQLSLLITPNLTDRTLITEVIVLAHIESCFFTAVWCVVHCPTVLKDCGLTVIVTQQ